MRQMFRVMDTCLYLLMALLVYYGSAQGILVSGTVTDTDGHALAGAQVTFRAEADSNLVFTGTTGTDGSYEVVLPAYVTVEEERAGQVFPSGFELFQNYPNPFNPSTAIPYTLAKRTEVELTIYNILGQRVRTLVNRIHVAGAYTAKWDGRNDAGLAMAAGMYVVRMKAGQFVQSRKMVMVDGASGGMARTGERLRRPLGKSTETEEAALYTVTIAGEDIIPFTQTGIVISEDVRLDFVVQRKSYNMVLIPAGSFQMGDHFNEGESDELPVHTVYVDAFYMDVCEVTNAQYCVLLNEQGNQAEGGYTWLDIGASACLITTSGGQFVPKSGYGDHPVIKVTWYGARAYAQWAGKRLPTEAEWEKTARGGLVGKRYPWGDEDPAGGKCNYWGYNGPLTSEMSNLSKGRGTLPVRSFEPNGYGLYDMMGNVWEWCSDWYDSGYYSRSPESSPTGPETGDYRVVRGGSWHHDAWYCRVAYRLQIVPWYSSIRSGFRCARTP